MPASQHYRIGSLHYNDQGTADSLDKAISHLSLAARLADMPGLIAEPQASEIRTSALFRLGKCQMKAGRQEEARKTFERVAGMDGINRHKDDARTELNNIALNPEPGSPAGIEYEKGLVAVKAGDRTGAKEHYLKAIALNAEHAGARLDLSILLATEAPANLVEAKEHYLKALALGARRDNGMDKLLGVSPATAPELKTSAVSPKNGYAGSQFTLWQKYARDNSDSGGLIALLDAPMADSPDPRVQELRKRLDGTHQTGPPGKPRTCSMLSRRHRTGSAMMAGCETMNTRHRAHRQASASRTRLAAVGGRA